jgi:hypothetical protein
MEIEAAAQALSPLGQNSRLRIFRFLVRSGLQGVAAGDIAEELNVAPPAGAPLCAVL